jgi:hypothetical protein
MKALTSLILTLVFLSAGSAKAQQSLSEQCSLEVDMSQAPEWREVSRKVFHRGVESSLSAGPVSLFGSGGITDAILQLEAQCKAEGYDQCESSGDPVARGNNFWDDLRGVIHEDIYLTGIKYAKADISDWVHQQKCELLESCYEKVVLSGTSDDLNRLKIAAKDFNCVQKP